MLSQVISLPPDIVYMQTTVYMLSQVISVPPEYCIHTTKKGKLGNWRLARAGNFIS